MPSLGVKVSCVTRSIKKNLTSMIALTQKGPHATCNFDVPGENREMNECFRTEITEGITRCCHGKFWCLANSDR
ncbi:unnamed protein product [Clavelina lepadiformis]|uniref:Uncharacterized protein n=1 Tax=Clavelina lepadiformis TaxID=159417 RepID=A0ABP0GEL5_CLALP